jgi:hypothetical protein
MSITEAKTFSAARPTKMTLFLRSFLPWQLYRFLVINIKMTIMILKSHGSRIDDRKK